MDLMAWWVRRPEYPTDHRRLVVDRLALVQFIRLLQRGVVAKTSTISIV
jgi:hypothetical protein